MGKVTALTLTPSRTKKIFRGLCQRTPKGDPKKNRRRTTALKFLSPREICFRRSKGDQMSVDGADPGAAAGTRHGDAAIFLRKRHTLTSRSQRYVRQTGSVNF